MTQPTHLYRKRFEHAFEAEDTAKGFRRSAGIDRPGPMDVNIREEEGAFYVYVALKGDVDPDELLSATGYERVT